MVIHLISSPRTVSTSLMYAFDNRKDTVAIDEPFYAYYLKKTGKIHPGSDDILREMPAELSKIVSNINQLANTNNVFVKNMGHHTIDVPLESFASFKNVFFIRDPKRVIVSFSKVIEDPSLFDLGIKHQWDLFITLKAAGISACILDSTELLKNPKKVLIQLCDTLGIDFDNSMLSWKAGPRAIDGSWAKYWYASTHQSTNFAPYIEKEVELTSSGTELLKEALPYYQQLVKHSIHN